MVLMRSLTLVKPAVSALGWPLALDRCRTSWARMGHGSSPGGRGQAGPSHTATTAVQFSRPIDPRSITTANSNHVVTSSLARPPALGSAPPAVQSAPRVGQW
jgi:hypothetical protein